MVFEDQLEPLPPALVEVLGHLADVLQENVLEVLRARELAEVEKHFEHVQLRDLVVVV